MSMFKLYLIHYSVILLINFWPLILLILISLFICYDHNESKKQYLKQNKLINYLDFFYNKNITISLFTLILLIASSSGLLLFLRYLTLQKTYNIWVLFSKNSSLNNVFIIILTIICFRVYLSLIENTFKDKLYIVYLYLSQYQICYTIFYAIWNHYCDYSGFSKYPLFNFYYYYDKIIRNPKINLLTDYEHCIFPAKITILYLTLLNKWKIFRLLFISLYNLLKLYPFIAKIEECLFVYLPNLLIFFVFIIDLKNNQLHYIYYALLFYYLYKIYISLLKFIGHLDMHDIDDKLVQYFYKDKIHETLKYATKKEYDYILFTNANAYQLFYSFEEKIKLYIEKNYINEYIDKDYKKTYEPYNMRIMFLILFIIYYIFCYNISWFNCIVISLPLLMSFLLYEYTIKNKSKIKKILCYQIIFLILILIAIIIIIYIYVTRHTFYFMNDVIKLPWMTIQQTFTLEEKYNFFLQYYNYKLENVTLLTKDQIIYLKAIIKNITITDFITDQTTIIQIRDYIDKLTNLHFRLDNIYNNHKDTILEKINKQLDTEKRINDKQEDEDLLTLFLYVSKLWLIWLWKRSYKATNYPQITYNFFTKWHFIFKLIKKLFN